MMPVRVGQLSGSGRYLYIVDPDMHYYLDSRPNLQDRMDVRNGQLRVIDTVEGAELTEDGHSWIAIPKDNNESGAV